jgi:hypothetical protein
MWAAVVSFFVRLFSLWLNNKSAIQKESEGLGAETQKVSDLQSALKTETAVASAEANAPSTVSAVEDRLAKGTF